MAVLIALAMPVLLGMAASAVDVSQWSSGKNSIQGATDNSVLSTVVAAQAGATPAQIQNQALAAAAAAGFTNGRNGVTVTVNNPPKSGSYMSNTSAYEVIIKQPQTRYFSASALALLGAAPAPAPTVSGRAVALAASNPACVLALDTSAGSAIGVSGAFNITAPNCAVAANSSSLTAVSLLGVVSLTASNLNIVGNEPLANIISGLGTLNAIIKTGAPATLDPYASLAVRSFSGCTQTNYSVSGAGTATINPGVYCGSITVKGAFRLIMNPGVYIINGGSFSLNGATSITGSGVSIVLTNNTGISSNWGKVTINGSQTLTLTAMASGPMQGVALYMDRTAPASISDSFNGATNMSITGSVYLPSQAVSWNGASSTGHDCLQLIARIITFNGAASFGTSCGSLTVPGFQPPPGTQKGVPAE